MKAAVVGLGKIGLPLAVQIAGRGIKVVGCDIDPGVVDTVNAGRAPFPGEPDLESRLNKAQATGLLSATSKTKKAVGDVDIVVVVVPLVVDSDSLPDFTAIDAATREIGGGLHRGQLVIYETTVPVGTTRDRFGPMLSEISGLKPGDDFYLAFSPERVSSGRVFRDLRTYPKLVGGIDADSTLAATAFYEKALEFDDRPDLPRPNGVWQLESTESAELAKLAETTYRDVNIALANEYAEFAEDLGLDVGAVIEACNSQPYSHIHQPGLVGGHCIPVYPNFYLAGHVNARLPRVARDVNESVAHRVVDILEKQIGDLKGRRIAILGATYRGGVKETAYSGVFPLARELELRGTQIAVHDPLLNDSDLLALGLEPYQLGQACEGAIVQADHSHYRRLRAEDLPTCRVILDLRGVVNSAAFPLIPVRYLGVGAPSEAHGVNEPADS